MRTAGRRHSSVLLALLLVGLGASPVQADERGATEGGVVAPDIATLATSWWAEDDADARGLAALRLVTGGATADAVADALATGRTWPTDVPVGTVHTWKRPGPGGHEHTCFLLVPRTYDPARPMRLLVWLHGGVARDEDGGGASFWQAHETDDALAHPEGLCQRGFGSPGLGRRQQDRSAGRQQIPGGDIHGKGKKMGKRYRRPVGFFLAGKGLTVSNKKG